MALDDNPRVRARSWRRLTFHRVPTKDEYGRRPHFADSPPSKLAREILTCPIAFTIAFALSGVEEEVLPFASSRPSVVDAEEGASLASFLLISHHQKTHAPTFPQSDL